MAKYIFFSKKHCFMFKVCILLMWYNLICRWFMPINIGVTFLCGGILGWVAVKLIKPKPHLEGLIIAMCSTGN